MATPPQDSSAASGMNNIIGFLNVAKEKWDASGANEAMARASAAVPENTRNLVGNLFSRDNLRSVTIFFGIGEDRPFYVEKAPALLMERIRHNLAFFYLNYILMTFVIFCITLVTSPFSIIELALLAVVWMWVIRSSQTGTLDVAGIKVPQKTAILVLGVFSIFALMYILSGVFWWSVFSSGFLIAVHGFLRDASMHKDMDDAVDMQGDLHLGEETSFLNDTAKLDQV